MDLNEIVLKIQPRNLVSTEEFSGFWTSSLWRIKSFISKRFFKFVLRIFVLIKRFHQQIKESRGALSDVYVIASIKDNFLKKVVAYNDRSNFCNAILRNSLLLLKYDLILLYCSNSLCHFPF